MVTRRRLLLSALAQAANRVNLARFSPVVLTAFGVRRSDAAGVREKPPPPHPYRRPSPTPISTPAADADFEARITALGTSLVHAYPMDDVGPSPHQYQAAISHDVGQLPAFNIWNTVPQVDRDRCQASPGPFVDLDVYCSGGSSIRFECPPYSGSAGCGMLKLEFTPDLSRRFGAGESFFIQWRQRFDDAFLTDYLTQVSPNTGMPLGADQESWPAYPTSFKQIILSPGNTPDGKPVPRIDSNQAMSLIVTSYSMQGFPFVYQETTPNGGSAGPLGTYLTTGPYGKGDIALQNAMPAPYCTWLSFYGRDKRSADFYTYHPPGCFAYVPNEWMTFQIGVNVGQVGLGGPAGKTFLFKGTRVRLWGAREGKPSQLLVDWTGDINCGGDPSLSDFKYGSLWIGPYMSYRDFRIDAPLAKTWYDEFIISTQPILDPVILAVPPAEALATATATAQVQQTSSALLSSLQPGKIRSLGSFNTGTSLTYARLEYGSLVSDPKRSRILLLGGGGHTGGNANDAGAFTGKMPFNVLYPADADSLISDATTRNSRRIPGTLIYASTNHLAAVHTFTAGCVRGDRYYLMTTGGAAPADSPAPMCWCDLASYRWTPIPLVCPWYYCASAETDPVSGKILVLGVLNKSYSPHAWLFDPDTNTVSAPIGVEAFANSTVPPDIHYDPARDTFICVEGINAAVHELQLDRANFANSRYTKIGVTGDLPTGYGENSAAFARLPDGRIVGCVRNGKCYTYDPASKAWASTQLVNEDGTPATASQSYAYLALDAASGCVVFMNQSKVFAFRL